MNLDELSSKELEHLLETKKKEEAKVKQQARLEYEAKRNEFIASIIDRAKVLHNEMKDFKQYCYNKLEEFRGVAHEYGDIRSNSKGGFSLRHSDSQEMVSLDRNTVAEYDERAEMAESLIKEFLEDKVKKKDLQTYRTIMALLEKNKYGDLTPGRVASLLKVKDNYDDERWLKAMELFEESFRVRQISYSVSFFTKDTYGKDKAIVLTFASIPLDNNNIITEQNG